MVNGGFREAPQLNMGWRGVSDPRVPCNVPSLACPWPQASWLGKKDHQTRGLFSEFDLHYCSFSYPRALLLPFLFYPESTLYSWPHPPAIREARCLHQLTHEDAGARRDCHGCLQAVDKTSRFGLNFWPCSLLQWDLGNPTVGTLPLLGPQFPCM